MTKNIAFILYLSGKAQYNYYHIITPVKFQSNNHPDHG